jgi:hypothetical protein
MAGGARRRGARRTQRTREGLIRLRQNLSFVISPLSKTIGASNNAIAPRLGSKPSSRLHVSVASLMSSARFSAPSHTTTNPSRLRSAGASIASDLPT